MYSDRALYMPAPGPADSGLPKFLPDHFAVRSVFTLGQASRPLRCRSPQGIAIFPENLLQAEGQNYNLQTSGIPLCAKIVLISVP